MSKGRITKRAVDGVQPGGKDLYLWDDELAGYGLKVTPAGRKVYLVQYQLGGRRGRTRRVTIGYHGVLTPTSARIEAKRLLGEVAAGRDPADTRDRRKEERSVSQALRQFLSEYACSKLRPRTAAEYVRTAEREVLPRLGARTITDVRRQDIAKLHYDLATKPYQANRTLALLSKFFSWAEDNGLRQEGTNPCRRIEKYRENRRERFLSEIELARLGEVLRAVEAENRERPHAIAAIRLLLLTGARLSEILTLQWECVDLAQGRLVLPESKTGRKVIRLNAPALEVLQQTTRLDGNPYVICGDKPGRHLVNLQKPWRRIRKDADLTDVRLHDLRHSFASVAAGGGQSLLMIGKMLGHTQPSTTARYAHLADDPLRCATETVGRHISAAMASGAVADVVKLRSAG